MFFLSKVILHNGSPTDFKKTLSTMCYLGVCPLWQVSIGMHINVKWWYTGISLYFYNLLQLEAVAALQVHMYCSMDNASHNWQNSDITSTVLWIMHPTCWQNSDSHIFSQVRGICWPRDGMITDNFATKMFSPGTIFSRWTIFSSIGGQ